MKASKKFLAILIVITLFVSTFSIAGIFNVSAQDKVLINFNETDIFSTVGHQDTLSTNGSAKVTRVATADAGYFNTGNSLKVSFPAGETQAWRWTTIGIENLVNKGLVSNATGIKFWAKAVAGTSVLLNEVGISSVTDGVSKKKSNVTISDVGQWYELPFTTLNIASDSNVSTYKYFSFRVLLGDATGKAFFIDDITLYGTSDNTEPSTIPSTTATSATTTHVTTSVTTSTIVTTPATTSSPTTSTSSVTTSSTATSSSSVTITTSAPTSTTATATTPITTITTPVVTTNAVTSITETTNQTVYLSPEMIALMKAARGLTNIDLAKNTFTTAEITAIQAVLDAYNALSDDEKSQAAMDEKFSEQLAVLVSIIQNQTTVTTTKKGDDPDTDGMAPVGMLMIAIASAGVLVGTKKKNEVK